MSCYLSWVKIQSQENIEITKLFKSFFTTKKGRGYKVLNVGNDKYPNPIKRISTNETYRYFDIE